jgi:hypothetical protein
MQLFRFGFRHLAAYFRIADFTSEPKAYRARNRRFESISLQRRVINEPRSPLDGKNSLRMVLRVRGETAELPLHCFDASEICCDDVFAPALASEQAKPALCKGLGCTGAAEVNYRG